MAHPITLPNLMQTVITPETFKTIMANTEYIDKARKFTVYELLKYWVSAAAYQWSGFRPSQEERKKHPELCHADYSTISKKAKDVPFAIFKQTLHEILKQCNRKTRRHIHQRTGKILCALDSTTMTVGLTRLPWAPYHGQKAAVKLHVEMNVADSSIAHVEESIGTEHDSKIADRFEISEETLTIRDRAYGKIARLDMFVDQGQAFVIRLRSDVLLIKKKSLKRTKPEGSIIVDDFTCELGCEKNRSTHRFRVVILEDKPGHFIRLATPLLHVSAECIGDIYKARWSVENLFRFLKQHLNLTRIFGISQNAVYGQLFCALITYSLLRFCYNEVQPKWRCISLTFIQFIRCFLHATLPTEAIMSIIVFFRKTPLVP